MSSPKAPSVLRVLLVAGVPVDRATEIAESAAKLRFGVPGLWQRNPPDPRALARLAPYTCVPHVRREERDAA